MQVCVCLQYVMYTRAGFSPQISDLISDLNDVPSLVTWASDLGLLLATLPSLTESFPPHLPLPCLVLL